MSARILPRRGRAGQGGRRGFTLVELLCVIAIMVLLFALMIPSITSLQQSANLSAAGQQVADEINLAKQIASTTNRTIQVRLIQLPNQPSNGYSLVQLWSASLTTSTTPVMAPASKLTALQQAIIPPNSGSSGLSLLLSGSGIITGTMPAGTPLAGANYEAFEISPSGVVTPAVAINSSYLSVVALDQAASGSVPANYVSVQIDPQTGTALVYRP